MQFQMFKESLSTLHLCFWMSNIADEKVYTNGVVGSVSGSALDTLAQPCQSSTFQKRARSKFFSLPLATRLAEEAKRVKSPLMEKAYRNSVYCTGTIVQEDGKLTARYCGNRWCLVCNRIRTARAIEAYKPVLEGWESPYMVTLTVRNCGADDLSSTLDAMVKTFASCSRSIRRTAGIALTAVRKLECTFNIRENSYHPHYHVIVDGKAQADLLRDLWLRRFPDCTEEAGQDVRPCGDGSLQELFKYFTKLTTKTKDKHKRLIPIEALHVIFRAMRGRRVWQPIGFVLPKEVEAAIESEVIEVEGSQAFKRDNDQIYWEWDQELSDWIDRGTGELLSEYVPSDRFRSFVESMNIQQPLIEESLPAG